jgi:hypothetical protein
MFRYMDKKLYSIWEQRLAEYEGSGKTIKAWCKEQTIRENQFYYWRKKLRTCQTEKTVPVKWLPLDFQINGLADSSGEYITVYIGQATVEVRKGFDHHLLREIVQVLKTI